MSPTRGADDATHAARSGGSQLLATLGQGLVIFYKMFVARLFGDAAYGIGGTTWEVFRKVVLPYTRVGLIGGVMLGLGRALGETMAVTFVIGNAHKVSASILAPGTTISATIANEFSEAVGDLYTSSLFALGIFLFVISFIVLTIARLLLARIEKRIG